MTEFVLNQTLLAIQPSPIRSFNDKISGIDGILKLTLGEPDFPTPSFIKEAAVQAINADLNGYTHSRGLIELRQAIARFLQRKYQLNYRPEDEIIVTVGATEALFATFMAILNPGDKVIVPSPNYVIYGTHVKLAGAELVSVDVSDSEFILTGERLVATLAQHPETKVLLLNHPCNPTGATYTREQLEDVLAIAKKHQLIVVSDEIYSELTYGNAHVSVASILPEQTILINGTSKAHAMTGWRSCFIAAPANFTNQIFKVHQAAVNTPTSVSQYASIAAYDQGDDSILAMRDAYRERRDLLISGFQQMGYATSAPQGAFYLFVKVPDWFEGDDFAFCLALAEKAKVGVVPGQAFGEAGRGYFRLSYAASVEQLQEALQRIATFTQQERGE
ncbi:aminotransferase class I/II-fold pyridoxal phosphate-dependent enzyme [Aerococcaceae bacterium NML210727]|nr:aminotransferase class I/II-fold pyridoxal phosphate-dependent enzyme [Aerococcaceae bacterium NML210727]MCW6655043.1 aminotransferase class I/II-fold pyridoxal phosphate-dependent enzyme [Aerococcaceae bacterium NML201296]